MTNTRQDDIYMHAHGFCNIFAIYASKIKKLECHAIIRYSDETIDDIGEGFPILIHAFLKVNDKLGFDAYGFRSIEKIYNDYGEPDDYTYHLIEDAYDFLCEKSTRDCFGTLSPYQINKLTIPLIKSYFLK